METKITCSCGPTPEDHDNNRCYHECCGGTDGVPTPSYGAWKVLESKAMKTTPKRPFK